MFTIAEYEWIGEIPALIKCHDGLNKNEVNHMIKTKKFKSNCDSVTVYTGVCEEVFEVDFKKRCLAIYSLSYSLFRDLIIYFVVNKHYDLKWRY